MDEVAIADIDPDLPVDAPWWAKYLTSKFRCISKEIRFWLAALIGIAPMLYNYLPQIEPYLPPPIFHAVLSGMGIFTAIGIARKYANTQPSTKD